MKESTSIFLPSHTKNKQEDPLRSYSLVSAIVCLFILIIVLKFIGNEKVTTFHSVNNKNNMKKFL